jgi:hypothetical protein
MPVVVLWLLAIVSQPAFAQTSADAVAIRATGAPLSASLVRAIADAVSPTRLTRSNYPEATDFTPRQVAQALCGTPPPAYLSILQSRNNLSAADLDRTLGDRIYEIEFPNCLYLNIFPNSATYEVKMGDTFSKIRKTYTGVQGDIGSIAHFFDLPVERIASGRLSVGETLRIPYATNTAVLPKASAAAMMEAVAAEAGPQTDNLLQLTAVQAGQIVSFVHSGDGIASTPLKPPECGDAVVHPFPAGEVGDAFEFALDRARNGINLDAPFTVEVMVVDNGFFGAKPAASGVSFRTPEFRQGFFDTSSFGPNLGPTTGVAPDEVFPINYQNGLQPSGPLSGHGTHVTGLVLGGPDFLDQRNRIFGATGPAWLKVTELNVGRASDQLLPGSQQQVSSKLLLLKRMRIINLSISYRGDNPDVPPSFGFMNQGDQLSGGAAGHLYVVAAGNERGNVDDYYPAALGGVDRSTSVITVAALDPGGALTKFTNVGPKAADVAAPGCNIESWVDDTSPPLPLSGTSQAAPIVSFQAALIRGLTNAGAGDLKARIIASGDLLPAAERGRLSADVKVNIAKSLYVFDDYVEYRSGPPEAPIVHKMLGTVLRVDGLSCNDGQGQIKLQALAAYKYDGTSAFGYSENGSKRMRVCRLAPPAPGAMLVMMPAREVAPGYPPAPSAAPLPISMDSVDDLVMRMAISQ